MRGTGVTGSLLAVGLVACLGAGCGIKSSLQEGQQHQGGTSGTDAGAGGASSASVSCVAEMGPNGLCKRCYDATGMLVHEDCPTPPATGNDGGATCVRITEGGGPGTCTDYATYKIGSADVCAQMNLALSSLEPGRACGDGGAGAETMTLVCCPPPAPAPVTCSQGTDMNGRICKTCVDATGTIVGSDCNTSVPGMMCVNIQDGGPTSCKDAATWKKYGTDRCAQQNMVLTNVIAGTPCGANYQDVTYVCCATTPSGSTGTGGSSGTGGSDGTGGAGGAGGVGMCIKVVEGDSTSCQSYDALKLDAYNQCLRQNLPLTGVEVGSTCDGGYTSITFTCCASAGPSPSPPPPIPTPPHPTTE